MTERSLHRPIAALAATGALVAALVGAGLPSAQATGTVDAPSLQAASTSVVAAEVHGALEAGPVTVIARLDAAAHDRAVTALVAAGGTLEQDLPLIDSIVATVDRRALDALVGVDGIRSVVLDGEVWLAQESGQSEVAAPNSNYVETVGADVLHAQGIDGAGVGIAIVDTGVSPVADLGGRLVGGLDISGDGDHLDKVGHGTFIAGVAAGDGAASAGQHAGVAPGATVIPIKIAGANGGADVSHVLAAIQYAVSMKDTHGIDVLNLSLGTDSTQPNALSPLNYAVERAWDAGLVVVLSAGNHGTEGAGRIPKPADDPLVITVGATDSNDTVDRADDEVAPYSSRGPSIADGIVKPDIVAPGSYLVSTRAPGSLLDTHFTSAHIGSGYARGSGTSFAAGVVSGAAALLLQLHPDWEPDQVKEAMLSAAAPGPVGDRNVDGFGALDVPAAAAANPTPGSQDDVARSTGLGSLEDDRGSLRTQSLTGARTPDLIGQPSLPIAIDLEGELTANGLPFDAQAFVDADWNNSGWYNSGWYNSGWYNSGWYNSGWYNSGWYNSGWYNSGWYNSGWYNSGWYNSGWYNSGWYNSGWYNSGWYNSGWYNSGWYNSGWY